MYDYLIVGAGLYGAVCANELKKKGYKILVIDKNDFVGGNCYTYNFENIPVHKFGAHIFRTNEKYVWDYLNNLVEFNRFTNSPLANYKGEIYNMPFNMNTFYSMWKTKTPQEAKTKIEEQKSKFKITEPKNLEEKALSLVGEDIYKKLIKGYSEKQWGKKATELPASIIRRLPLRFTYDNNYYKERYQGIPIGGYTNLIEKMFDGVEVKLSEDYFENRKKWDNISNKIIFTGRIDKFYDLKFGSFDFRGLRFEEEVLDCENYQGNAVINYTDFETPYTRVIEHKHFEFLTGGRTIITKEYPDNWDESKIPYYPINDEKNNLLYEKYKNLASQQDKVVFGGRLGEYKYYDMNDIVINALEMCKKIKSL